MENCSASPFLLHLLAAFKYRGVPAFRSVAGTIADPESAEKHEAYKLILKIEGLA